MSVEALAMAGIDYNKCDINLEEKEGKDKDHTPQYLLAEQNSNRSEKNEKNMVVVENVQVKTNAEAWPEFLNCIPPEISVLKQDCREVINLMSLSKSIDMLHVFYGVFNWRSVSD